MSQNTGRYQWKNRLEKSDLQKTRFWFHIGTAEEWTSAMPFFVAMSQPQTIEEAIDANARGPASVTIAGETVTAKDIQQLIEADRYLASKRAQRANGLGITLKQIVIRAPR